MPDIWMDVDAALAEVPVNLLPLIDDTDFKTRETSIAYNQAGMDLVWNFVTPAGAMTQTAVTPTTGGNYDWAHQGDGIYSIEIPASGGASINNDTEGVGWFTGYCTGVLPWRGPTIGFRRAALNDLFIEGGTASTNMEDFFDGTGYAGGTAKLGVDVIAISSDTTAADNLETMLDGTGGNILSLGQLNIVASGNNSAIVATGSGSGNGVIATGGATSGSGIVAYGYSGGMGISATGGVTGDGIKAIGGDTSGNGITAIANGTGNGLEATGNDTGYGILATGGSTGHGIGAVGGATSGDGLYAVASGNGYHGIEATGVYDGDGIHAQGGSATGAGIYGAGGGGGNGIEGKGGSSYGDGIRGSAGNDGGVGLAAIGRGIYPAIYASNAGTGAGIAAVAGGNSAGIEATGAGSGAGIKGQAAATGTGPGIMAEGPSTSGNGDGFLGVGYGTGHGMHLTAGASGDDLHLTSADSNLTVTVDEEAIAAEVDSVLSASHGAGDWTGGGAGSGSVTVSIPIESPAGTRIPNAAVYITLDEAGENIAAYNYSNSLGIAIFHLDPGTYYSWAQHTDHSFDNPTVQIVT